jgi:hypothetical protein
LRILCTNSALLLKFDQKYSVREHLKQIFYCSLSLAIEKNYTWEHSGNNRQDVYLKEKVLVIKLFINYYWLLIIIIINQLKILFFELVLLLYRNEQKSFEIVLFKTIQNLIMFS